MECAPLSSGTGVKGRAHRRAAFVLRKLDSLRVLEEAGLAGPSYATLKRRLPVYPSWLN
jgi:hypothetical protein